MRSSLRAFGRDVRERLGCASRRSTRLAASTFAAAYPVCSAPARMGTELLIVLAFLIGNGLFAGAEIAILSVRTTRLREFIRRRDKRALAIKTLRDHPERFLATVQVCITTFGTAASVYGGATPRADARASVPQIGLGHGTSLVDRRDPDRVPRARDRRARAEVARAALLGSLLVPHRAAAAADLAAMLPAGRVAARPRSRTWSCGSSATRPRSPRPGCRATSSSSSSRRPRRPARSIRAPARLRRARSASARSRSPR